MAQNWVNVVTGGAGFIGANLTAQLLRSGQQVIIYDNFSRPGCKHNLDWLQKSFGTANLRVVQGDVRNLGQLRQSVENAEQIYHFAGQVAVTTSVQDPRLDFETNALGTFNVLEAARLGNRNPIVIYASTNKVYGALVNEEIEELPTRYALRSRPLGIDELHYLDFHSPYGCSKGVGDQYVHDYARIYGMRTIVFRQSCIYGPRQFGLEDQGWVAWFIAAALRDLPIVIFGDGKQVRDILHVDDLTAAMVSAVQNIGRCAGEIYNIGGGPANTISIWNEFGPLLEERLGRKIAVTYREARPGDQRIYVSDISKAKAHFGWQPKIPVQEGVNRLIDWVKTHLDLFSGLV